MSSAVTMDVARSVAAALTRRERYRNGGNMEEARARLADRMKVLPGTLCNLARNRLKRLDGDLRDKLTAFAIADLRHEIARHEHDLELALQMGAHPASVAVSKIEARLARLKALIGEADAAAAASVLRGRGDDV